jgi:TRAP-type mannitol/chloroaromatic compound transport system permease large subunit
LTDPALGLLMLGLIVIAVMMGFPTAFTLMGLGMFFGFAAFYDPSAHWIDNHVFDLFVQRTYGAMTNETLLSIPLFVLMGYVMERGALVDRMFEAVQLAFARIPASLAVTTLVICTFWGIASGLVGAVVVLMGVIALGPMLRAGYDPRLASGVIAAGGTLGILIPPSVMIIVYAAVAGQSVVRLYAAAMLPGFFLATLYLVYIVAWALIDKKVAPPLPPEALVVHVPRWAAALGERVSRNMLLSLAWALAAPKRFAALAGEEAPRRKRVAKALGAALMPLVLAAGSLGLTWWYVVDYRAAQQQAESADVSIEAGGTLERLGDVPEEKHGGALEEGAVPKAFYTGFWIVAAALGLLLAYYYRGFGPARFVILEKLTTSVMPLAVLTLLVLVVILLGITTATESAAVGAAGAFLLAWQAGTLTFRKTQEAMYLTAKTTAMVCWLFVGSALFSAVFALHGGQALLERWVLSMDLTPWQFMLLSQAIIFVLGWPLEWTEIVVIFVPIFLPMLKHYQIDPILWGTLVFVNLQAAFLSPPVAMSAYYLKGVAPPHVTLNTIFAGMMPYMLIVILCMALLYIWPGLVLWLPDYLYGK